MYEEQMKLCDWLLAKGFNFQQIIAFFKSLNEDTSFSRALEKALEVKKNDEKSADCDWDYPLIL